MKYRMEFDVDFECDDFLPQWACISTITTEGNDINELISNIVAYATDQDGGDLGEVELNLEQFTLVQEMIKQEHSYQLSKQCPF